MIYLYYGDNSILIREKLAVVKERYWAKYASGLNFWKFDLEADTTDLRSVLESQSMFEEKKLILIRGIFLAPEEKWASLEELILHNKNLKLSQEVILILYDFENGGKSKKRLEFLKKLGEAKEFKNFDKPQLVEWCLKKAEIENIKISKNDLTYLVNNLNGEALRVWNEVCKLSAYGQGVVDRASIDKLVQFDVTTSSFKVIDALLQKHSALALKNLEDQWHNNEEPMLILGALVWQFRLMLKLADAKVGSTAEAVQKFKMNPWVAQKTLLALKKFSVAELKNIYQNLADIDLGIKTGQKDGREALADFVYSFL